MSQAKTIVRRQDVPRLFVIADRPLQRIALAEMIQSCGYDIVENLPPDRLKPHHLTEKPDLWLLDVVDQESLLDQIGFDAPVMFGIDPAPQLTDRQAYSRWMRVLSRKLFKLLGHPPPLLTCPAEPVPVATIQPSASANWQYVCVLAASMGGPNAVKAFLDRLPSDLPIAFLCVQHIDPYMQELLPRILVRHNDWQSRLIKDDPVLLNAGEVVIVPALRMISMNPQGLLTPLETRWPGQYQPSITEVMLRASQAFGRRLITIVFSGMGDDGSQAADQVWQQGGQIWAQTASSCDSASQPDAMRATGRVSFNGNPEDLALRLQVYVQSQTAEV
ncbi:MAG: chemotaxis protein CheB [Pseudomonadota bacterium]|nr:chemotaxis protein CheB [Pseudomonadota bacterium]